MVTLKWSQQLFWWDTSPTDGRDKEGIKNGFSIISKGPEQRGICGIFYDNEDSLVWNFQKWSMEKEQSYFRNGYQENN